MESDSSKTCENRNSFNGSDLACYFLLQLFQTKLCKVILWVTLFTFLYFAWKLYIFLFTWNEALENKRTESLTDTSVSPSQINLSQKQSAVVGVGCLLSKPYGSSGQESLQIFQERNGSRTVRLLKAIIMDLLGVPEWQRQLQTGEMFHVDNVMFLVSLPKPAEDRLLQRMGYLGVDLNQYWSSPKDLYKKHSTVDLKFFKP